MDCNGTTAWTPANHDEPLQLVEFKKIDTEGSTSIQINEKTLSIILNGAGDLPLCSICICGPSRQGKSFVLGYMIRCLEALEQGEDEWIDWNNKSKPLSGFKFKNGTTPETQGIWVWSRPFIVTTDSGEKVAVLLIDTQGTNDEFTTNKDMSSIVGLSLLTSSVMIFNFFNNLQEDTLLALNTYVQYGLLALENQKDSGKKPFQKLTFLIRDWNIPCEHAYGGKGGKEFLEKKLQVKDEQPPEAKQVRETIKKCFQELDCYLMPQIGEKALMPGFTGSIAELNLNFAKKLEDFISTLISSETLVVKEILGSPITAHEFKDFLHMYTEIFNSSEMPTASAFWEGTSQLVNDGVVDKSMKKYHENMKKKIRGKSYLAEDELEKAHSASEKLALASFKKAKKFGDEEKISELEEKLEKRVKKDFVQIKSQNEDKRGKYISNAVAEAQLAFKKQLEEELPLNDENETEFYEESKIQKVTMQEKSAVIDEFKEKLSENENEEKIVMHVTSLEKMLNTSVNDHITKNAVKRLNAEKLLLSIVDELVVVYTDDIKQCLENDKFIDSEELKAFSGMKRNEAKEQFQKRNKPGGKEFHKQYSKKLEECLDEAYKTIETSHKCDLQQIQLDADELISEYYSRYEEQMAGFVQSEDSLDAIHSFHIASKNKITESFKQEDNPFPGGSTLHEKLNEKLNNDLEDVFERVKRELTDAKRLCEESYREAVDQSFSFYVQQLKEAVGSDFIEEEDLQVEHDHLLKEALEKYEEFDKVGALENEYDCKIELNRQMEAHFESVQVDNKTKRELARSNAKNCVHECHNEYQKHMKESMDKVRTQDELEEEHNKAKELALTLFEKDCPVRDPDFQKPYIVSLEGDIEDAFEEVKDLFDMKRSEEEAATKEILVDARRTYNDEMEKHFKNHLFINPSELQILHETAVKFTITKCEDSTPLSAFQKLDLQQELESLFENFSRKNDMNLNSDLCVAPAIGIDLGTTYCCVAVYHKGQVIIIPNHEQGDAKTTPSYVSFNADGTETIGHPAKENAYRNPEHTIYDAKRILGRSITDPHLQSDMKYWPFTVVEDEGVPKIHVNGSLLYPEQISGKLITEMRMMAERHLKMDPGTITKAVITVPAYFSDGQRSATRDAGEVAGLKEVTILNEPTAAAIAYTLQRLDTSARKVLIFDMGGGTFDVAVLNVKPGEIDVLGVAGDTHLGGEDFDKCLMEYCALEFQAQHGIDLLAGKDSTVRQERDEARRCLRRLQTKCEESKKVLTSGRIVTVSMDAVTQGIDLTVEVKREKFEELIHPQLEMSIKIVETALSDAGIRKEEIEDIVLVGGSTRIPKVQEMLKEFFNGKTLTYSVNPDEAVAYGAAVHAAILNGGQAKEDIDFSKIQDVTPMSLGIETASKEFSIIIPKNSKVPIKRKEVYFTFRDNQTSACIKIYEGEEYMAKDNKLLGEFVLNGIPPASAGRESVDVTMEVNSMGILQVEAISKSSREKNSITVTENKQRMSRETIRRILDESQPAQP